MSGLGFNAPWVLLAALAVAGPIVAHLARHEDRDGRGFPSLMFLRRVPFPTRSRRKLADRVLLALRILAVLAAVLGFAQPYVSVDGANAAIGQGARVVLLDRSYSMGIGDRFERARRMARDALSVRDDSMRVALVAFDASASTLSGFAAGSAAALQALHSLSPGNRSTDLSKALAHASRLLAGTSAARRELILISDLQLSGLGADPVLASDIELQVQQVDDRVPDNLALMGVWYDEGAASVDASLSLRVRVANTGDEALSSTLRIVVDGLPAAQQEVRLAAGANRDLLVPVFVARERPTRVQLSIGDDALAIDNSRYLVIAPRRPIEVLWIADSATGNAFVNTALSPSRDRQANPSLATSFAAHGMGIRVNTVDVADIDLLQLDAADVIVLEDVMPNATQFAARIESKVAQGAGLLTVRGGVRFGLEATRLVGQQSEQAANPLASAVAGVPVGVRSGPVGDGGTTWSALVREHAIAVALDDATLSGIAVRRHQALDARAAEQVLARFKNGAPALIEREHGRGRSMTMAASLHPQVSDLVLDPVFVPLMVEVLVHLSQRRAARLRYQPGDVFDLASYSDALSGGDAVDAALRNQGAVQLRAPSGGVQRIAPDAPLVLVESGFYELRVADAPPLPIAVNSVAEESLLAALTVAQFLERLHRGSAPADSASLEDTGERRDSRIAWWLLGLALLALFAESLLGSWSARQRALQQASL